MNIESNYTQGIAQTTGAKKQENLYETNASNKKDYEQMHTQTKVINKEEDLLANVNMPNKEKEAMNKALNQMHDKDSSLAMMAVMAPSSMNANPQTERLDFNSIMQRVNDVLNPPLGGKPSKEMEEALLSFQELFLQNFDAISAQDEDNKVSKQRDTQLSKAKLSIV